LEEALERSQQTLQQEVERSQRLTEEEKIAAAQVHSTAQLLSELEQANESLKRQTLLSEALTAQLKASEERTQRLESECAILRKRKVERAQELQTAEATCADLRSRLQRQQQYTLQFKAALEKSLDTPAPQQTAQILEQTSSTIGLDSSNDPTSALPTPSQTLGLPRSGSIRPWSANEAQAPTDPQLLSLMRSQPSATDAPAAAPATQLLATDTPATAPATQPFPTDLPTATTEASSAATVPTATEAATSPTITTASVSHDADQQLWQDVERIIDRATPTATDESAAGASSEEPAGAEQPVKSAATASPEPAETASFTEPIPWGAPIIANEPEPAETAAAPSSTSASRSESVFDGAESLPDANNATPATTDFELPSEAYRPSPQVTAATHIPALEAMQTAPQSPSPLVNPLRSTQRKRKSLSAVELPNFPPLPKVQN
ncbi:MAG: hypothetical protein AAF609_07470, partial [Cyanobacteria bacterium P01_C01_bin.120]